MVQQSLHECDRIRRVILHYFLEDDTISIYETRYENSALVQVNSSIEMNEQKSNVDLIEGQRVRRHRLVKNDQNEFYHWKDLNVGQMISIYGTNYRLCDCDPFTRVNCRRREKVVASRRP